MPWVVDSCVLLDVAIKDETWGVASAKALDSVLAEGLVVCPVSVVEIAPQFHGEVEEVLRFLAMLGVEDQSSWLDTDTRTAARAWSKYVSARRNSQAPKRPVADLLIGAFASRFGKLVTRNPSHFQPWFADLRVLEP